MDQSWTFHEVCAFFQHFLVKVGTIHLLLRCGDATQSTRNDPGPDMATQEIEQLRVICMVCHCLFSEITIRKLSNIDRNAIEFGDKALKRSDGRGRKSCSSTCFHLRRTQTCLFFAMQLFTHMHTCTPNLAPTIFALPANSLKR